MAGFYGPKPPLLVKWCGHASTFHNQLSHITGWILEKTAMHYKNNTTHFCISDIKETAMSACSLYEHDNLLYYYKINGCAELQQLYYKRISLNKLIANIFLKEYVACYKDSRKRLLTMAIFRSSKMTVELCSMLCTRKKTRFFGVEVK